MKKLYNIAFFCLFALFLISCGGGDGEDVAGGGTADTTPPAVPTITVTSPTNVSPQTITGTKATDASSILVSVDGGAKAAAAITSTTAWSYDVSFTTEKTYAISVTAKDAAGNESSAAEESIVYDTTPPDEPTIDPVNTPTNTSPQTINGAKVEDAATIWVNGVTVGVTYPTTTSWSYSLALSEGANPISVTAKDAAGNESSAAEESIVYDSTSPDVASTVPAANAIEVPLNTAAIVVNFNEPMDETVVPRSLSENSPFCLKKILLIALWNISTQRR
jgi:large repetitive protein